MALGDPLSVSLDVSDIIRNKNIYDLGVRI